MRFRTHALPALAALAFAFHFASAAPANALTAEEVLNYKGADRDKVLYEGAKKEGQVVFYSGMIPNQTLRPLAESFQKKYAGVKLNFWRADSEEIVIKMTAEQRAGNMVGDVLEGTGVGELAVEAGLVQPFTSPVLNEYPDQYHDPRHLWAPTRLSYFGTAYNTKQVSGDKIPRNLDALLEPAWQSKMAWSFAPATGAGLFLTTIRLTLGEEKAENRQSCRDVAHRGRPSVCGRIRHRARDLRAPPTDLEGQGRAGRHRADGASGQRGRRHAGCEELAASQRRHAAR